MQVLISDNFLVFSFFHIFVDQYQNIKIYKTEKVPLRIKCPKAEMLCNPQKSFRKIGINNLYLKLKLKFYFLYFIALIRSKNQMFFTFHDLLIWIIHMNNFVLEDR